MTSRRPTRTTAALLALGVSLSLSACGIVTGGGEEVGAPAPSTSQPGTGQPSTTEPSEPTGSPTGSAEPTDPTDEPSTPTTPPTTPPTTAPTTPPTTPTSPPPVDPDLIRPGAKGPQVLALQQELVSLGYWLGTADGTYGDLTQQAVLALQKTAGIGRDGTYGPATRKALEAGTVPRSTTRTDGVEINLATQVLTVWKSGKPVVILNTSTGSGESYTQGGSQHIAVTPKGSYQTFRSVDGEDVGPLGALWRPRYFNGGIAVHGYTSVPAYPASHGCARVSNAAMNMIWSENLMPVNGRVTVF